MCRPFLRVGPSSHAKAQRSSPPPPFRPPTLSFPWFWTIFRPVRVAATTTKSKKKKRQRRRPHKYTQGQCHWCSSQYAARTPSTNTPHHEHKQNKQNKLLLLYDMTVRAVCSVQLPKASTHNATHLHGTLQQRWKTFTSAWKKKKLNLSCEKIKTKTPRSHNIPRATSHSMISTIVAAPATAPPIAS